MYKVKHPLFEMNMEMRVDHAGSNPEKRVPSFESDLILASRVPLWSISPAVLHFPSTFWQIPNKIK
ncbi:hypothetical protein CFIMG_002118RA [Ceratocystis fimbriata CBS 114723]|uniref:Uncharacterized protein n=1 Tax=Ceratocystis fimbriata CBS 114723 TaxID=1035309 RepID=A0A2C5WZC4_9PEZI|nr:hypothetical protein CFIMG_002118RA [Ceratocystis fimbriata CBS 114723]